MAPEKVTSLMDTLKEYKGKKLVLVSRGAPDPDWISSAITHQYLAESVGAELDIVYAGEISHRENRALMKVLEIDIDKYSEDTDFSGYAGFCLVDSQAPEPVFERGLKGIELISVVDHHDKVDGLEAKFVDVDTKVKASATQYSEILKQLNAFKNATEKEVQIATALYHGLWSDTGGFVNIGERDGEAIAFLSGTYDKQKFEKIVNQSRSAADVNSLSLAIRERETLDSYLLLSNVGILSPSETDARPGAADFLMELEGINTVYIWSVVNGTVILSARTKSDKIKLSEDLEDMFGDIEGYDGGGKGEAAGCSYEIGSIAGLADGSKEERLKLLDAVAADIRARVCKKYGIKEKLKSDK